METDTFKRKRAVRPTRKGPIAEPVSQSIEQILPSSLRANMSLLEIPASVVSLVLDTTYVVSATETRPLFALARHVMPPHDWVFNYQEIQEIIRIYDRMKGIPENIQTGRDVEQFDDDEPAIESSILSDEEVFNMLKSHIEHLVEDTQKKLVDGLLIPDSTVYESPLLEQQRQEEARRIGLLHRKRRPIKGIHCSSCKNDEAYEEVMYTRSGDESGVWYNVCAKCDYKWKKG